MLPTVWKYRTLTVRSRFYAAEACVALRWFHDMNLLYRSLSLYHMLLGLDGHIKLVDFSVSKIDIRLGSKTKSFCGTSEFMAPEVSAIIRHELHGSIRPSLTTIVEMLLDRPYDSSIDWWQLGIVTYQMMAGRSPFRGEDEDEIYDSILEDEPQFPAYLAEDAIDFIRELLRVEPERRLGSGTNGADQVMAHTLFTGINWDDLYHKRVPVPFTPTVADRTDAHYFDSEFALLDMSSTVDTAESKCSKKLQSGYY